MKTIGYFLILFFLTIEVSAQLSGKILNTDQKSLEAVTIFNLRSKDHTHSDANGFFYEKTAMVNDTLRCTLIGHSSFDIVVTSEQFKNTSLFIMKESPLILNQIDITEPLHRSLQKIDLHINPINNSQELLQQVPGLFIAQHAGGGKAEQIFLRGFDIDHGTDVAISVDNVLPVNMVSHAHGQGYADLHFLIPETVHSVEFEKGSYNASAGNFATSASVNFKLKERIPNHTITFESGKFQTNRLVALFKLMNSDKTDAYAAGEYITSDGYFEHPQDFERINLLGKYHYKLNNRSGFKISGSYFSSHWRASGQIPQRAVDSGIISRFGSIDPDEGGITHRSNTMLQYYFSKNVHQLFKIQAYHVHYDFELYSNFSFFLNDSIHGDQIRQKEKRNILGIETQWQNQFKNILLSMNLGLRSDNIKDSELSHTKNRNLLLERKALGNISERNAYAVFKLNYHRNNWDIDFQGRYDIFRYNYKDKLQTTAEQHSKTEGLFSPKLNLHYNVWKNLQIYAKCGFGFHSNDSRLLINNRSDDFLTTSFNTDLGMHIKPGHNVLIHAGIWTIYMEDELVYTGDEAIVEGVGNTLRKGIETGLRWQPVPWLLLDAELTYTLARLTEANESENFIPLASKWNSSGGIAVVNFKNTSLAIRYRYLGDRPANESGSITAKGYTLIDANLNYQYKNLQFGLVCENLLNTKWNEAQFASTSRLQHESLAIEEIHFTPGTPFNFRIKIQMDF
jgi:outer membrane receptor protein involved in Fe transport